MDGWRCKFKAILATSDGRFKNMEMEGILVRGKVDSVSKGTVLFLQYEFNIVLTAFLMKLF